MSRQAGMLLKPTEEECVAACVKAGMPAREGTKMFVHYEMVRWTYGRVKAPIASLALAVRNWKLKWEDAGCPGENGQKPVKATNGAVMIVKQKELERVLARMGQIHRSYDANQDMRPNDIREMLQLKKRRDELKRDLGVLY